MRIVNAMFGRGRGGLEQVFLDYCEALAFAGHKVLAVIHPRAAIRPVLERREVTFHSIDNLGAWDPVAALRLRSWLRQQEPDAVMAHGNRAISLLKGAGAKPLIGVAANYTLKGAGLDAILCATEDLVRHSGSRGFAAERISLIPHMVAAPASPPLRIWRQPPVIGAMGRFVAKKGFDVLIEALRRLETSYRVCIAGDGPEAAALKDLARRRGLEECIEFPGWQDDVGAFFDSIDVFCLPSLHEPFGIVLLEAMAQALPVIATDSEGPSEILHPGINGIIVPKGDPGALAAAIGRVLGNPDAAQSMGLKAHATVRENYSLSLLSARLDEVLRQLVG